MGQTAGKDAMDNSLRDRLYQSIHEEFVGPTDPASEELIDFTPSQRYNAGVLHPKGASFTLESAHNREDSDDKCSLPTSEPPVLQVPDMNFQSAVDQDDSSDDGFEEPISLSNARAQSALSMTVGIRSGDAISIEIDTAVYRSETTKGGERYRRHPLHFKLDEGQLTVPRGNIDGPQSSRCNHPLDEGKLSLWLVHRRQIAGGNIITVAICNMIQDSVDSYSNCYYQTNLRVTSSLGLIPPAWTPEGGSTSEEETNKRLIYRKLANYAIGHGCATSWDSGSPVRWAETRTMPVAETHSMKPLHPMMKGVSLTLRQFADEARWPETLKNMRAMCSRYETWISDIATKAASMDAEFVPAAKRNVGLCRTCLARIRGGIDLLVEDSLARRAFIMANEAMYEQYLHYSVVSGERESLDAPLSYERTWRPSQLGFILMNLLPIVDDRDPGRGIVDLIWFPTGGGKTEAYLGLTAFMLIWERLADVTSDGVTVFMRYTLRLLTSQQFDRASSLICALESMRRRMPEALGTRQYRIGLWVGGDASPNTREDAEAKRAKWADRKDGPNPFPVRRCPWCGEDLEANPRKSYRRKTVSGRYPKIVFTCPSHTCDFSTDDGLPLDVVDEEVYLAPPSLLVGTIDKFAMIPYREDSYALFGIRQGKKLAPPKLIIQDELHLISGPLGSMAGHYEALISHLCERNRDDRTVGPKIIASTATVSRAKEQCNELYACGENNVFQFPPSGIDYDDSFFSIEDKDARGRRYVGVFVPTLNEASTNIRLYADLLWQPATWNDVSDEWKDRYWTTIGYFNTTRELGQAVTWMGGDIPERLWEHRRRAEANGDDYARYINICCELTGRKDADEVRNGLASLSIPYPDRGAVDLCFATNMISVGLDVGRLGLMVVEGQPKTTAEYIQATSRVGRGDAKGMVFVVYNTTKPRDRSHYENFSMYHRSFYENVEPSSVTAFCRQVRYRALFGALIGIYRASVHRDDAYKTPDEAAFEAASKAILQRVELVDPDEIESTKEDVKTIRSDWESHTFDRWEELKPDNFDSPTPLMHPLGSPCSDDWSTKPFEVPTSMRSVDSECSVKIVGSYSSYTDSKGR